MASAATVPNELEGARDATVDGGDPRGPGPHPAVLGFASGGLLFLAYRPVGAWWLAWVALVPLLLMVRSGRSRRAVYLGAWLGGLAFWLPAVEWVRSSHPSAWPGWLGMAAVLSIGWPAALGLIRVMVRRLSIPLMIAAPAGWVALEYVRAYEPFNGFHWFYLAHSQVPVLPLIQVADLAGAWTLSVLVAMANAWAVDLIERGRGWSKATTARRLAVAILPLAAAFIYGWARLHGPSMGDGPRLALLQSDIPQDFERPPEVAEVFEAFSGLIREALDEPATPDLIVWPETMYPYSWVTIDPGLARERFHRQADALPWGITASSWRRRAEETPAELHELIDRVGVPMLLGINAIEFRPGGPFRFNAALLLRPGSAGASAYRKRHLVPFGEYLPLVETLPWVLMFTPFDAERMPDLDPGDGPAILGLGDHRLAVAICFEDSVPQVTRSSVASAEGGRPPDVLINISNDGWFRGTAAHRLHLDNSVLRAVELRIPVARAVNTGVSAIIDGDGVVRASLPEATEGVLSAVVPLDPRSSLYARTGDWLPIGCALLTFGALPAAFLRHPRMTRRRERAPS